MQNRPIKWEPGSACLLACLPGWSLPSRSAVCSGLLWRENVPFFLLGVRVMSLACPVVLQAWFLLRVARRCASRDPGSGDGRYCTHTTEESDVNIAKTKKSSTQLNRNPPQKRSEWRKLSRLFRNRSVSASPSLANMREITPVPPLPPLHPSRLPSLGDGGER